MIVGEAAGAHLHGVRVHRSRYRFGRPSSHRSEWQRSSRPLDQTGRGLGPRARARKEALEKYCALLLVSFGPRFQEGVTNLGHTAAFASSNDFQISLEIRSNSKRKPLIFFHWPQILTFFSWSLGAAS